MAAGTARHNRVILNLARHIGDHLDDTPCQVFAESMNVQITDGMLYPDVMVTCGKAEAGDEQTVTDPKLIIELLSPSTKGYGNHTKKMQRSVSYGYSWTSGPSLLTPLPPQFDSKIWWLVTFRIPSPLVLPSIRI